MANEYDRYGFINNGKIDFDKDKLQYHDSKSGRKVYMLADVANTKDKPEGRYQITITAKTFHFLVTGIRKINGTS